MHDYSKKKMFEGEREAIIDGMALSEIYHLTAQTEGYMREYPGKEENEALEYIRSREWYYENETPEFPTWRDWFKTMTLNSVKEHLKRDQIELSEDELNRVINLIYKTMDEFRFGQGSCGYFSYRIGFRKFEP